MFNGNWFFFYLLVNFLQSRRKALFLVKEFLGLVGIHLVAVLLTSQQDLICWYPGSTQGPSKLPGSHRKARGKSERWFCSSKTLAGWCFSSFLPPPQEQQQHLHREDTTVGLPHSQTWVLQWLFAMRAIVSQVRYKTGKFSPLYGCCRLSQEDASLSTPKLHLLAIPNNCQYTCWGTFVYVGKKSNPLNHATEKRIFLKAKF